MHTLNIDPLPPPMTLFISKADFASRQITFNWSRVVTECPDQDVHYNILASNYGSCPTTTNHTSVTCTNVRTNSTCTFAIQTVVCGYIMGNKSDVILFFRSPDQLQISEHKRTGAIVSASLLATILFMCGALFTTIFLIMLVKLKESKRLLSVKHQLPDESNYEVVKHQGSSDAINTG